jgi:hypothetical protein
VCEDVEVGLQGLGTNSSRENCRRALAGSRSQQPISSRDYRLPRRSWMFVAQRQREKALRISTVRFLLRLFHSCTCCSAVVCIPSPVFCPTCSACPVLCTIPRHSLAHSTAKIHPANTALRLSLTPRPVAAHHHHHVGQAHPVCSPAHREHAFLD